MLKKCDAILRIKGESKEADQDVKIAQGLGLKISYDLNVIPDAEKKSA
ncbi:MAG: hypothetical protein WA951_12360 [Leeuwenhoekiella sp.]